MNNFYDFAPKGFRRLNDVVLIQNDVLNQISGQIHTIKTGAKEIEQYIKEKELSDLEELKSFVIKKEQDFYSRIGVKNYQELRQKVEAWNSSGAYQMLQDTTLIEKIANIIKRASYTDLTDAVDKITKQKNDEIINILWSTDGLKQELDKLGIIIENVIYTGLKGGSKKSNSSIRRGTISIIVSPSNFNNSSNNFINSNYIQLTDGLKGITLTQRKNGNIEIHFTKDMSMATQRQLTDLINEALKKQGIKLEHTSQSTINEEIRVLISNYLYMLNPFTIDGLVQNQIINRVIQEYMVETQNIQIGRSRQLIRGALGEIYWTAFFIYIGLRTSPVGKLTSTETNIKNKTQQGKQIPVDIVFEGCGAQVKNYTVDKNNIVRFNSHFDQVLQQAIPNKQNLANFLVGRGGGLQMSPREARLIYGRYWFSEQYNKRDVKHDVDGVYVAVEERFSAIDHGIETYFRNCIDKLLKFNYDVTLDKKSSDLLVEDKDSFDPGKPIFFIINDIIYPTSYIIDQIELNLKELGENDIIAIKVENFFMKISDNFVNPQGSVYPNQAKPTIEKGLESSEITYSIDVNVLELAKQLCNIK